MQILLRKIFFILIVFILLNSFLFGEESKRSSIFIVSPMAGIIQSEILLGNGTEKTKLKENGQILGVNLIYTNSKIVIGNLIHNSKTQSSNENGYLFFTQYYFNNRKTLQPMIGMYVEYINIFSQLTGKDSYPFNSLDVNTSVLALHPIIGISYALKGFRITPFVGYFNEQVETVVSSPGMKISGQNRYGIKSQNNNTLDYASFGSKLEFTFYHFIRLDMKIYYRITQNDEPLLTTRNRIDLLFSKNLGISVKFDYFQDKYESTIFTFIGPSFIF